MLTAGGISSAELSCWFPSLQVHEELQDQLDNLEPHLLTDLVWSLCVLQQAKAPYLQRVLAPEFHTRIRGEAGRLCRWDGDREPQAWSREWGY